MMMMKTELCGCFLLPNFVSCSRFFYLCQTITKRTQKEREKKCLLALSLSFYTYERDNKVVILLTHAAIWIVKSSNYQHILHALKH